MDLAGSQALLHNACGQLTGKLQEDAAVPPTQRVLGQLAGPSQEILLNDWLRVADSLTLSWVAVLCGVRKAPRQLAQTD